MTSAQDNLRDLPPEAVPSTAVPLLELRDCHCRWPIGSVFCGAERVAMRPYCEGHWARAKAQRGRSQPLNAADSRKRKSRFVMLTSGVGA